MRNSLTSRAMICALLLGAGAVVAPSAEPEVAIRSCAARAKIFDRLATTTVDMVFVNYTTRQQEVVFQWQTDEGTVVGDLAMWVAGLRSPAVIHPRASARRIYEQIVRGKRDPALLEYFGRGRWQLRVFPIPPNGTQKVQVVFRQLLAVRDGWVMYRCPLPTGGTIGQAQDFDFAASIAAPGGVADLKSGWHKLGVQRRGAGAVDAGFRKESFDLSKPVELSFRPATAPPQVVAVAVADGALVAADVPAPKKLVDVPASRNVVVVVDRSESMRGDRLKLARLAAKLTLARLTIADAFAVVAVGSDAALWKGKLTRATQANVAEALKHLDGLTATGGTDLAAGLRAAESLNSDRTKPFFICLFSDGEERIGVAPDAAVAKAKAAKAVAAVAPGENCDLFLMELKSDSGLMALLAPLAARGVWYTAGNAQDVALNVKEFMAHAARASEADIDVKVVTQTAGCLSGVAVSDWRRGQRIVLAGRSAKKGAADVEIVARAGRQTFHQAVELAVGDGRRYAKAPPWVGRAMQQICAHFRARRMWRALGRKQARPADLAELVALSRRYRLPTLATAYLILESEKDYRDRGIERAPSVLREKEALSEVPAGLKDPAPDTMKAASRRLRARARELRRLGDYARAAAMLDEVHRANPWDDSAKSEARLLREFLKIRRALSRPEPDRRADRRGREWHSAMAAAGAVELPVADPQQVKIRPTVPAVDRAVLKELGKKLPRIQFPGIGFGDVVQFFRDVSKLSIHVKWEALRAANIDERTPVNIDLKSVPLDGALRAVLDDVGGVNPLDIAVEDGIVTISTKDDLARYTVTRVYDVRDLLSRVRMGAGPPGGWLDSSGSGDRLLGGGSGLFGDGGRRRSVSRRAIGTGRTWGDGFSTAGRFGFPDAEGTRIYDIRDMVFTVPSFGGETSGGGLFGGGLFGGGSSLSQLEAADTLMDTVRSSIAPETWRGGETPGMTASMREFGGVLIVTQTQAGHMKLVKLLAELRLHFGTRPPGRRLWPEAMFIGPKPAPWVAALIRAAREGRLSKFSSIRLRQVAGRAMVRIGGLWCDAELTGDDRVVLVHPQSAAGKALLTADPKLRELLELWPAAIVRVADGLAVCADPSGLTAEKHADVVAVLTALKKGL